MKSIVLVTGGCGFIGSNLVRSLLRNSNNTVINIDKLTYAGNPDSLADVKGSENYVHELVDIADEESVLEIFKKYKPDTVYHLAAESHVDRSIDGPAEFIHTNILGTYSMLQCALQFHRSLGREAGMAFRFVHISTDEVYGSLGEEGSFSENSPYDPHSPYSASKAASDHLAKAWCTTYGLPLIVTNCSNNYGPFQFPEKLLPLMVIKCLREEPLPVYGQGDNVRDWLFVDDHVDALQIIAAKGKVGHTYNIGGNTERRNIDLVTGICSIMDEVRPRKSGESYQSLITFVGDRPGHDYRYAIDASKLRLELGWAPATAFESALRNTVLWYIENETWWTRILNGSYRLERLGGNQEKGNIQ